MEQTSCSPITIHPSSSDQPRVSTHLFEFPSGSVSADQRGEHGQQEHDDGQENELGPVQEHAALPVVLDLVERSHPVRYVVAPVPGLQRGHASFGGKYLARRGVPHALPSAFASTRMFVSETKSDAPNARSKTAKVCCLTDITFV